MARGTFSTLQHLLKQAYSTDVQEQQQAAIELANLIEQAGSFPAVSFGPLSHALSKLVPSTDRTVASYSARALKLLLLDDALRPQSITAGVPAIVIEAVTQWEDEILVLREIVGILQTLCWDSRCVRHFLQPDLIASLIEFVQMPDVEVSSLALATIANMLSHCDTLLLADSVTIECLGRAVPVLIQVVKKMSNRSQRFYAMAGIANAAAHPLLQSILKSNGALELVRDMERQSSMNLEDLGSKMGECAHTAARLLGGNKTKTTTDDLEAGKIEPKYSFKWGTQPTMELLLASYGGSQSMAVKFCVAAWVVVILFTLLPLAFV